ncbi:cellulose binding domain-containing protein [Saccharothrix syringae]|uniref:CBM2 domain-containing protein n=1 Tax=Saccharothrix syringae TaxID=103733 RepID=A0A5Q0GXM4_SACSY|nr:cellulose binding domain-containing protein [Saccharothrix syringae]QFZ18817.1 hypothetical protein EKG83_16385 [Saccharothrix syringae]
MQLKRALSAVLPTVAGVLALTTTATAAPAPDTGFAAARTSCDFDYRAGNSLGSYSAALKVTNTGSTSFHHWQVEFDLSPGATIGTLSGGTFVGFRGHIRVLGPEWLSPLAPGGSANFTFSGPNTASTGVTVSGVTLNGVPCTA